MRKRHTKIWQFQIGFYESARPKKEYKGVSERDKQET